MQKVESCRLQEYPHLWIPEKVARWIALKEKVPSAWSPVLDKIQPVIVVLFFVYCLLLF